MATSLKTRQQSCGTCGKTGHNRRTCTAKTTKPRKPSKRKSKNSKTKKQLTHIAFVLDSSASMNRHRVQTRDAFNELVSTVKEQSQDQDLLVSYYTFGSRVNRSFFDQSASTLQPLAHYDPREGRTALYEAIRTVIRDFKKIRKSEDSSFLVQIVTDGQENKRNVSQSEIQNLIRECQDTDRWTFAISCPDRYMASISQQLGIFEGNIQGWDPSSRTGMETVRTSNSVGLRSYLGGRKLGKRMTKSFFAEVNVGRQGVRAVKKGLKAEPKTRFRRLKVDKARGIKDFIESKKLVFQKGRVFYALSKPEKVQSFKEIVLQKRSDPKTLYGGDQVRDKLGIPRGQEGKVSPGNLGEWVVWIQSTSSNRKLLAKMEVLYDTSPTVKNGRN